MNIKNLQKKLRRELRVLSDKIRSREMLNLDEKKEAYSMPFNEFPPCEMCGNNSAIEKLITKDGRRIVACNNCGLWFTSPRIQETVWVNYLKKITNRSIRWTENRLKYGVALPCNVKYVRPGWRKRKTKLINALLEEVEQYLNRKIQRLHDVGCGAGFLLQVAQNKGIDATGNDLNAYACQVMKERLGLKVYNDSLLNLNFQENSIDVLVFKDYIEHTYHPLGDLKAAYRSLKPSGIIYIETFHTDCYAFDRLGKDWNMLFWNHVFHFSTKTLSHMIKKAGFTPLVIKSSYDDVIVKVFAAKPKLKVK